MGLFLTWAQYAQAGGPIGVGSSAFGVEGQPFKWSTTNPIQYRTDGGNLGTLNNTDATNRVIAMFQKWQDVASSNIAYSRAGSIQAVSPNFTDGDVSTVTEYNAATGDCTTNPVIYDADGTLFTALGRSSGTVGFAGPCISSSGQIVGGLAAMNGKFIDGNGANGELNATAFDGAIIHEIGHFSGLDHSQINVETLIQANRTTDNLEGLPTMFPLIFSTGIGGVVLDPHPFFTLSTDDIAWISGLYPDASLSTTHGTITGTVFFSDGQSHAQGVNVIARRVDDAATVGQDESRRIAVSVVSGYLFTPNPGQNFCCDNAPGVLGGFDRGSRDPDLIGTYEMKVPAGDYTIEVEAVDPGWTGGSSVGPLDPPFPLPGATPEFWNDAESATDNPATKTSFTVAAGATVSDRNIILNNTDPRFDQFEDAGATLVYPQPFLRREREQFRGESA